MKPSKNEDRILTIAIIIMTIAYIYLLILINKGHVIYRFDNNSPDTVELYLKP